MTAGSAAGCARPRCRSCRSRGAPHRGRRRGRRVVSGGRQGGNVDRGAYITSTGSGSEDLAPAGGSSPERYATGEANLRSRFRGGVRMPLRSRVHRLGGACERSLDRSGTIRPRPSPGAMDRREPSATASSRRLGPGARRFQRRRRVSRSTAFRVEDGFSELAGSTLVAGRPPEVTRTIDRHSRFHGGSSDGHSNAKTDRPRTRSRRGSWSGSRGVRAHPRPDRHRGDPRVALPRRPDQLHPERRRQLRLDQGRRPGDCPDDPWRPEHALLATTSEGPGDETLRASVRARKVVGAAGFEPTTTSPPDWCATRLRHAPTRCRV